MMQEDSETNSAVKSTKYRCHPCLKNVQNVLVLSCKTKNQKIAKYKRVSIFFWKSTTCKEREYLPMKIALWKYCCIYES